MPTLAGGNATPPPIMPTSNVDDVYKKELIRTLPIAAFRGNIGYGWRTAKIPPDIDPF